MFQNHLFSSPESELSFYSEGSEVKYDRARTTTVNPLLSALRALFNISNDDGKVFFANNTLVY